MKIAFLGPAPPYRGGISLFALMLARAMQGLGHEVVFYNFLRQYPKLLFPGKEQFDSALATSEFSNIRSLTPWLPFSWWRTAQHINSFKPDIILVSWFLPFFAPAYGWILRHTIKVPKVILAHNVAAHENWAFALQLMLYTFKPASKIVLLSKATLFELQQKAPLSISKRGVLGFHPSYDCYASVKHRQEAKTLLFFGLIKPYKGLDILLSAMPLVLAKLPEAKLVIAGEVYGDSTLYEKQIQALGINHALSTHFRYISDPEISAFFAQASLCILPYKSASQSGVIATSYSFGVPVLASDVGGLGEYVLPGKTGYLVPPENPEMLASAIITHLQNNPDLSSGIAEYCTHHSWKSLAELVLQP